MATQVNYSNTQWDRTLQTTMAQHIADVEPAMLRNFKFGALLESEGRTSFNSGAGFDWRLQYRLHEVSGTTGETVRNFARRNLWKTAALEYRGYTVSDMLYYKELRENSGKEALIKVVDGFAERLEESLKQGLAPEFYVDGNASGNETSWHGKESFFGTNGTVNVSTGAQRTANASDPVCYPSDTYATLATDLGTFGGDNESSVVWPEGIADPEYDAWTPLIVNYTSTYFAGSAATWAAQCDEALSYAMTHAQRNSVENMMDTILLNRKLFWQFKQRQRAKERINVTDSLKLRSLGFKDTIEFDGVEIGLENAIPSAVGYGFSVKNCELRCLDETLYRVQGPVYDIDSDAYKTVVSTLSNLRHVNPRNELKLVSLA
jgi:hypothetical protein